MFLRFSCYSPIIIQHKLKRDYSSQVITNLYYKMYSSEFYSVLYIRTIALMPQSCYNILATHSLRKLLCFSNRRENNEKRGYIGSL